MKRLFCLLVLFSFSSFTLLQTEVEEYNLKAVFIYNFTKYINVDSFAPGSEFVIGILGDSPISEPLAEIAQTKTVNGKKIIIQQFSTPQQISFTNVLFISKLNTYSVSAILQRVAAKGTLTIAEEEGMAKKGVAMNFVIEDNKLKFEANLKAISSSGLKASSDLLQHAIIVNQ